MICAPLIFSSSVYLSRGDRGTLAEFLHIGHGEYGCDADDDEDDGGDFDEGFGDEFHTEAPLPPGLCLSKLSQSRINEGFGETIGRGLGIAGKFDQASDIFFELCVCLFHIVCSSLK